MAAATAVKKEGLLTADSRRRFSEPLHACKQILDFFSDKSGSLEHSFAAMKGVGKKGFGKFSGKGFGNTNANPYYSPEFKKLFLNDPEQLFVFLRVLDINIHKDGEAQDKPSGLFVVGSKYPYYGSTAI